MEIENKRILELKKKIEESGLVRYRRPGYVQVFCADSVYDDNLPEGLTTELVRDLHQYDSDFSNAALMVMRDIVDEALTKDPNHGGCNFLVTTSANSHISGYLSASKDDESNIVKHYVGEVQNFNSAGYKASQDILFMRDKPLMKPAT